MRRLPLIIICTAMLSACHNDPPMVGNPTSNTPDLKEHFINANRTIAQSEETSINEYVARRKWDMQKLPEGVRLWEYEKGRGPKVNVEDSVHIVYSVEAINGKLIYSDITDDYVAGRRQQMIGLDQAVLQLSVGSRAKVILPSNLAYGIGGDGDRIPQSAILVIDVKVN